MQFELNSWWQSEVGAIPFEAEMGPIEKVLQAIPANVSDNIARNQYMSELHKWLGIIRENMRAYQAKVVEKRTRNNSKIQNTYAEGDFVLFQNSSDFRQSKLSSPFAGPIKVLKVYKDDLEVEHMSSREISVLKNDRVKPFFGSEDEAKSAAQLDYDHYYVLEVKWYVGDPSMRTSMEFEVCYGDGTFEWRNYNADLASTEAFKKFIAATPELYPLKYTTVGKIAEKEVAKMKKQVIVDVNPGQACFVHLRAFGQRWYSLEVNLPHEWAILYMVECVYSSWVRDDHTRIRLECPIFNRSVEWSQHEVFCFGMNFVWEENFVKVDAALINSNQALRKFKLQ